MTSTLKTLKSAWFKVRNFDYKNLSFLYVACLFTIAFVYTIFRFSQYYLGQQEVRALDSIQKIGSQREVVSELERLIAFAQNRTAPQYPVTARLLLETYSSLTQQHRAIIPEISFLKAACARRPCADVFNPDFFAIPRTQIEAALIHNRLALRAHNVLLQQLFDYAVRYHMALKDTLGVSFEVIQSKSRTNMTFDFIAYLSLIALLIIQALYVFRPAIRKLNASLSTRSDFMSRISHEIRNPMNSIIGMADILKSTKLNSEQALYVDNLVRSGHALLDMLNNLIDSSALERGKVSLKQGSFDLYQSIDRCIGLVALPAHHKNINLYLHMNPEVPAKIHGDSVRLEQVMINLLSNAVKFTEQGSVSLEVNMIHTEDRGPELSISVTDTGIGIKEELLARVFESFVQADSSIQRKYGGSGLGLAIASELVRMMGGELKVSSDYGQGSRFSFNVPLQGQDVYEHPLKPLGSRRFVYLVSYAESSAYQNFFAKLNSQALLLHSSHDLRGFFSGRDRKNIDEILIDDSIGIISMITCRNVAEENGLGDKSVAVIRSGLSKENMDLLRKNGFTRFIVKPLKPWAILSLPHSERDERGDSTPSANAAVLQKLKEKNLRVLLVDDSDDNLFLLKEVVSPISSHIHFAENGLEGLEKFERNHYDVVFMDIQMPVMDGYTAVRKMREIEDRRSVPIYAVTAHAGLADAQKCIDAGFTDRIVKPLVRGDIYASLAKAFALSPGKLDFQEDEGAIPQRMLDKLMPTFIKARADDLEKLNEALKRFDYEAVARLGHKMKGSSASYGIEEARNLSDELEAAAKSRDAAACKRLSEKLQTVFGALPR
jgi:signal transduction histidine kinase/CheY-like chemotaxis protein/HPt (histidine-containing phosphotransfer) domain-containing protein